MMMQLTDFIAGFIFEAFLLNFLPLFVIVLCFILPSPLCFVSTHLVLVRFSIHISSWTLSLDHHDEVNQLVCQFCFQGFLLYFCLFFIDIHFILPPPSFWLIDNMASLKFTHASTNFTCFSFEILFFKWHSISWEDFFMG